MRVTELFDGAQVQPSVGERRFITVHLDTGEITVTENVAAVRSESVEAMVRATLEEHGSDILACAGVTRLAIRVEWETALIPIVSLQGDLEGTPTQECVRGVLGESIRDPSRLGTRNAGSSADRPRGAGRVGDRPRRDSPVDFYRGILLTRALLFTLLWRDRVGDSVGIGAHATR